MCDQTQDKSFVKAMKPLLLALCVCGLNISPCKLNRVWQLINVVGVILSTAAFVIGVFGLINFITIIATHAYCALMADTCQQEQPLKKVMLMMMKTLLNALCPGLLMVEFRLKLKMMKSLLIDISKYPTREPMVNSFQLRITILTLVLMIGQIVTIPSLINRAYGHTEGILQFTMHMFVIPVLLVYFGTFWAINVLLIGFIGWLRMIVNHPLGETDSLGDVIERNEFVCEQIKKINRCFRLLIIYVTFSMYKTVNMVPELFDSRKPDMDGLPKFVWLTLMGVFILTYVIYLYHACKLNNELGDMFKVKNDFIAKKGRRLHMQIYVSSHLNHQIYIVTQLIQMPRLTFAWAQELTFWDIFQIVFNLYEFVGIYKHQYDRSLYGELVTDQII